MFHSVLIHNELVQYGERFTMKLSKRSHKNILFSKENTVFKYFVS